MTSENKPPRCGPQGFSFLFQRDGQSICVEAPSLAAIEAAHPDLTRAMLSEVWCHGCANALWLGEGPWEDAWTMNEGAPETVTRHEGVPDNG